VGRFIRYVDGQTAYVQVGASGTTVGGRQLLTNAAGGPVDRGDVSVVGEDGPEIVVFQQSGTVIPNDAIRRVGGAPGSGSRIVGGVQSGPASFNFGDINVQLTAIGDLRNPNGMDVATRQFVWQLRNAIKVIDQQFAGSSA
jgi:hypothetical protein